MPFEKCHLKKKTYIFTLLGFRIYWSSHLVTVLGPLVSSLSSSLSYLNSMIQHYYSSLASILILFARLSLHCTGKFSRLIKSNFLSLQCQHPCNSMWWRKTHNHAGWSHSKFLIIITSCGPITLPKYPMVSLSSPQQLFQPFSSFLNPPQLARSSSFTCLLFHKENRNIQKDLLHVSLAHLPTYKHQSPYTLLSLLGLWMDDWGSQPRPAPTCVLDPIPSQCHTDISLAILPLSPASSLSLHFPGPLP